MKSKSFLALAIVRLAIIIWHYYGEFSNGNRVLIVHDVLVSGEQIIHTKNHIPSRCEIVALCCLATRKDVNGLEVLQRENVRVERVIDLSDAEIESLMNQ